MFSREIESYLDVCNRQQWLPKHYSFHFACLVCFLRQDLIEYPRLALNWQASCIGLPSAEITHMDHYAQLWSAFQNTQNTYLLNEYHLSSVLRSGREWPLGSTIVTYISLYKFKWFILGQKLVLKTKSSLCLHLSCHSDFSKQNTEFLFLISVLHTTQKSVHNFHIGDISKEEIELPVFPLTLVNCSFNKHYLQLYNQ
jgi:hypothetical protein